ncbi:hypothetical protein D3C81_2018050 [compost metagenome]
MLEVQAEAADVVFGEVPGFQHAVLEILPGHLVIPERLILAQLRQALARAGKYLGRGGLRGDLQRGCGLGNRMGGVGHRAPS